MSNLDVIRRLDAMTAGRPLPVCSVLHLPKRGAAESFVCVFVRAGGEARPWGVAWGRPDRKPRFTIAAEPRDLELVAIAMAEFADALLDHVGHAASASGQTGALPHVWMLNGSHVEMLHCLAFAYTGARKGEPGRVARLNALGRLGNWLYQETRIPEQTIVVDAAAALRRHFAFPADSFRQQHLGFLLAQLTTKGGFAPREAAATVAEQLSVSTSLSPADEAEIFESFLEPRRAAKEAGDAATLARLDSGAVAAIERELQRRYDLVCQTWRLFHDDKRPVSSGVEVIEESCRYSYEWYLKVEDDLVTGGGSKFPRATETDRWPVTAARKFQELESAHERAFVAFVHDDDDALADAVAGGEALRVRVTAVRDEGTPRKRIPVWTVDDVSDQPLRLRIGDLVCVRGAPKLVLEIRATTESPTGQRVLELEVVNGKRGGDLHDPLDAAWWRRRGTFAVVKAVNPDAGFRARQNLADDSGPGAWLTHREPPRLASTRTDNDDSTDSIEEDNS
jgi:hypothetical protein